MHLSLQDICDRNLNLLCSDVKVTGRGGIGSLISTLLVLNSSTFSEDSRVQVWISRNYRVLRGASDFSHQFTSFGRGWIGKTGYLNPLSFSSSSSASSSVGKKGQWTEKKCNGQNEDEQEGSDLNVCLLIFCRFILRLPEDRKWQKNNKDIDNRFAKLS